MDTNMTYKIIDRLLNGFSSNTIFKFSSLEFEKLKLKNGPSTSCIAFLCQTQCESLANRLVSKTRISAGNKLINMLNWSNTNEQ